MDEPTSALDKENKDLLIDNIKKLSVGKTLIIISHDNIHSEFRKYNSKMEKLILGGFTSYEIIRF